MSCLVRLTMLLGIAYISSINQTSVLLVTKLKNLGITLCRLLIDATSFSVLSLPTSPCGCRRIYLTYMFLLSCLLLWIKNTLVKIDLGSLEVWLYLLDIQQRHSFS
jgi:hypothetical protein